MPNVQELTCQELVELVTEYLEGELSPEHRVRFDHHLVGCPYCRIYLEQMRQTVRTLGYLPKEGIPPHVLDVLLAHFRRWKSG